MFTITRFFAPRKIRFRRRIFRVRRTRTKVSAKSRELFLTHKARAEEIARERLAHFNQTYKFTLGKISIRNQKTRWGSCSTKGNINFNYKIALLPPHLADYIIVHELCHLGQFNHSQKFWDLVAVTIPDYRLFRDELKKTPIARLR